MYFDSSVVGCVQPNCSLGQDVEILVVFLAVILVNAEAEDPDVADKNEVYPDEADPDEEDTSSADTRRS